MDNNKIVIGVCGHIDAGKTTLAECLLYKTKTIRKLGRVDHEDAFLDYNKIEKEKGITIFNKEARFKYLNKEYIYIDTPGHHDFSKEANRALKIIDCLVLIISANENNYTQSKELFDAIKEYHLPIIIFVNKMDIAYQNEDEILKELKEKLSPNLIKDKQIKELIIDNLIENIDEALINKDIIPIVFGSALKNQNIEDLLNILNDYIKPKEYQDNLNAYIYRANEQYSYLKIISGTLKNKTIFDENNKINEIYLINGNDYKLIQEAYQNDVVAVKGLNFDVGTYLPSLIKDEFSNEHSKLIDVKGNKYNIFNKIKVLNKQIPDLNIRLINDNLYIDIDTSLQEEIVSKIIKEKFNLEVTFKEEEKIEEIVEEEIVEEIKEEHYQYQRMKISDAEVLNIFNNTFNPKQRNISNNKKENVEEKEYKIDTRDLIYLIDGYNLLHFNEELDEMAKDDLFNAREKVINIVADFNGYVNAKCILVFDAYKNNNHIPEIIEKDNLTIVYTKIKQSADFYIQNKTKELAKDYRVTVVTSDLLEQMQVFAYGANRLSSKEFYERYNSLKKNNVKTSFKPNKPFAQLKQILLSDDYIDD